MKILQVTDTHLGVPGEQISGLSPIDRLRACVADIEANHGDAAFCVFSGDLTDAGKPEAYRALSEVLDGLNIPVVLMMGNHDNRRCLRTAFPDLPNDENGFVQNCLGHDAGDFIFLDTVDQGSHAGLYCKHRRCWLSNRLDEAAGRPVYLFMHHPPFDVGLPSLDEMGLRQKSLFADLLSKYDNVRHIFFGHVHRPIAGSWQGIPFTSLRGTNHGVALDFTTTGYVPKSYEPPSYAVILIDEGKVLVHLNDFLDDSKMILNDDGIWVFAHSGAEVTQRTT